MDEYMSQKKMNELSEVVHDLSDKVLTVLDDQPISVVCVAFCTSIHRFLESIHDDEKEERMILLHKIYVQLTKNLDWGQHD